MSDNKISIFSFVFKHPLKTLGLVATVSLFLTACGSLEKNISRDQISEVENDIEEKEQDLNSDINDMMEENVMTSNKIDIMKSAKPVKDHNPVMVQRFGADPYALVYDGRVYLYMTGDKPSYNPDRTVKDNTYSNIDTICVISSDDLVNWTDHGTVYAAGRNGAAVTARV